jgi:hypothetical protein
MRNIGKVFDLDDRQVVVLKNEIDDKTTPYEFRLYFNTDDGTRLELGYSFKNESTRDLEFDKITQYKIDDAVTNVIVGYNRIMELAESYGEDDDDYDDGC